MSNAEDKTLCALQEEGYIESHTEDSKKLIQPARFFEHIGMHLVFDLICFQVKLLQRNKEFIGFYRFMTSTHFDD
jgi:hypothetical protein